MKNPDDDIRLSAHLDGELEDAARTEFLQHLAGNADAQHALEGLEGLDVELRAAFDSRHPDAALLRNRVMLALPVTRQRTTPRWRRAAPFVSAAAGILIGVAVGWATWSHATQPSANAGQAADQQTAIVPPAEVSVATLDVAQGEFSCRINGTEEWERRTKTSRFTEWGQELRTGDGSSGTVLKQDGTRVRIDQNSAVRLVGPNAIAVTAGRCFVKTQNEGRLSIRTLSGEFFAGPNVWCEVAILPPEKKADPDASPRVKVTVLNGTLGTPLTSCGMHQTAEFPTAPTPTSATMTSVAETAWIHPLLGREPDAAGEIAIRTTTLLEALAASKSRTGLDGSEIRSLGIACTGPLLETLEAATKDPRHAERRVAARILADLASLDMIPRIISLLDDGDAVVRQELARGLERLTGTNPGIPDGEWVKHTPPNLQEAWRTWLRERGGAYGLSPH